MRIALQAVRRFRLAADDSVIAESPARRPSSTALTTDHCSRRMNPRRISKIVYLAGDSYPKDEHIELALRNAFAGTGVSWCGQAELLAGDRFGGSWQTRLRQLKDLLQRRSHDDLALIGRSSGARIVTRYAAERPVAAVVALGYPFRAPGREPEPSRFEHLAGLTTPTLIVQGRRDRYGGADVTANYVLAPAIKLRLVDNSHEFGLHEPGWADALNSIRLFLLGPGA
jgi:pimeloyl-ACP methyl ester carboxylesterase